MLKKFLFSLLVIFCSSFLLSSDSFAVSDVTYTIDSTNYSSLTLLCGYQTIYSCSDFSYIYIVYNDFVFNSVPPDSIYLPIEYTFTNSNRVARFPMDVDFVLSSFPFNHVPEGQNSQIFIRANSIPSNVISTLADGWSITITLSESNPFGAGITPEGSLSVSSNGTYDVTDYASVVIDVPTETVEIIDDPISNDFQKVFFAIVEKIIPVFGILLVVWFGIDMLSSLIFGRGR